MSHSRERRRGRLGQTLIEVVLAVALASVAISIALAATNKVGLISTRVSSQTDSVAQLDVLADQLSAAAGTATAIYTPPSVGNVSSLVFLQYDNSGVEHRWGWSYNTASQTLTKCTQYNPLAVSDYDLTCTGSSSSMPLASFAVTTVDAATLSTSLGLPTQQDVATEMDSPVRDPAGIVVAGNMLHRVSFGSGTGIRTVNLLQGATPVSATVIAHQNQSPAVGAMTGPNTIRVMTGVSTAPTYTESNYGQYVPYLGPNGGWSLTPCAGGVGTATVTLSSYAGDSATFSVVGGTPGTCTFDVVASETTYPVTVTIGAAATPTPTPPGSPSGPTATPTPPGGAPVGGTGTPSPDPTYTPTPTATATPSLLNTCAKNYGTPTFNEPGTYDSPTIQSLYDQVDGAGATGAIGSAVSTADARTPNGNTIYGFFDHYPSQPNQSEKGAILISENTDCSLTFIMTSTSEEINTSFELYIAVWPDSAPNYSYDTSSFAGGGTVPNQSICYQAYGESYFPNLGNGQQCYLTEPGKAASNPIGRPDLQPLAPSEDRVLVPCPKCSSGNLWAVRWLMHPDSRLTLLPIPEVGHAINRTTGGSPDYWQEGTAWYGTGLSSASGLVLLPKD